MDDSPEEKRRHAESGLCASCVHARTIESAKGSQFLLCDRSFTEPEFPKYPRLPVLTCKGYEPPTERR